MLLQVVFHADIEREAGRFTESDVCDGVCRKLILRLLRQRKYRTVRMLFAVKDKLG